MTRRPTNSSATHARAARLARSIAGVQCAPTGADPHVVASRTANSRGVALLIGCVTAAAMLNVRQTQSYSCMSSTHEPIAPVTPRVSEASSWSSRGLLAVIAIILLSACSVDTYYTHVQQENGVGMKAPITHTVRVRLDTLNRVVTWLQDTRDAHGVTDRRIITYGDSSGSPCEFFDRSNWKCELRGAIGEVLEAPEMKEGRLSRFYWSAMETYSRRRRIWGITF